MVKSIMEAKPATLFTIDTSNSRYEYFTMDMENHVFYIIKHL